jgi:hypothetical protein
MDNANVNFALPPAPVSRPIPFRWIFPLGQLILCLFLLGLVHVVPLRLLRIAMDVTSSLGLLNMPAMFLQLPEAILRADHNIWTPPGLDPRTWQALSSSILGMLFWWMAGRAIEALRALKERQCHPQINWFETIVGFLIMSGGAMIFCAGVVYGFFIEHAAKSIHLAAAGGLWALLGGLSVIARFRQWRLRKKMFAQAA